jgi:chlorinating enzyme
MTIAETSAVRERSRAAPRRSNLGLTPEEIEFFDENGFVGPLTLCSPEEMAELREWIDAEDFLSRPSPIYGWSPRGRKVMRDWHLVHRRMHWMCAHPTVSATMASIMGPDLLLWRTQFMPKDARSGMPVAWHQDLGFPGHLMKPALSPAKNISAWIAIDRADMENGCVCVVPGTHKQKLAFRMDKTGSNETGLFGRQYKLEYIVDTSTAVPMVLEPGQYFLFNESALHGSTHNPSPRRRLGIAIRVTTPEVKIYEGQTLDGQGFNLDKWGCVVMSGEDRYGRNKLIEPPFVD